MHDLGIELRSAVFYQTANCFFMRKPRPVAAVRDHRVVSVDDADDARDQRNVGSLQARGIAFSIHRLVMMQCVETRFFKTGKESQNRPAVFGMPVDERALIRGERAVLFQDRIGNADLADVVQERRDFDLVRPVFRNIHLARDTQRPLGEPGAVNSGADVLQIEELVKRANQRVAESEMLLFQFLNP